MFFILSMHILSVRFVVVYEWGLPRFFSFVWREDIEELGINVGTFLVVAAVAVQ